MRRNLVWTAVAIWSLFILGCGGSGTVDELKKAGVSVKDAIDASTGGKHKAVVFGPDNFKPELVAKVKGVPTLRILNFSGCAFTDDMVTQLDGLDLISLNLSKTKITDAGVEKLTGLATAGKLKLINLNLGGNSVTDAGAAHLEKWSGLNRIHLHETSVTEMGFEKLKKALPKTTLQEK